MDYPRSENPGGGAHGMRRLLRPLRSNPRKALAATAVVIAALGSLAGLAASGALTPAASTSRAATASAKPKLPDRPGHGAGSDGKYAEIAAETSGTTSPTTGETAAYGTPAMDATDDPIWNTTPAISISASNSPITATDRFLWDSKYLYVLVTVNDSTPVYNQSSPPGPWPGYQQGLYNDSVDFWINWTDSTSATYSNTTATGIDITRGGAVAEASPSASPGSNPSGVVSDVVSTSTQYTVEAAFPWPDITRPGDPVGINTSINDTTTPGGGRSSYITWDTADEYWLSPADMPTLTLTGGDNNGQIFSNDNPLGVEVAQTADVPAWPQLASGGGVTYSVADPSVATVSSDGIVTGVSAGTTTITATASGLPSEQITVDVTFPPGPYGFTEHVLTGAGSGLVHPAGIALDASGDVWTTDAARNDVEEFSPQGRLLRAFGRSGSGNGELSDPEAITISGGDVYVADTGNNRVEEFTTAGAFVQTIGGPGTGNGQFTDPRGVAVDASGDVWVADTLGGRVEEFTPAGSYVKSITGLSKPQGISFDSSGDLWVADTSAVEYSPSGTELESVGLAPSGGIGGYGGVSDPEDVAPDNQGDIVVTEPGYDLVQEFSTDANYEGEFGLPVTNSKGGLTRAGAADAVNNPDSAAVSAAGDVFVADRDNHRIVEFVPRVLVTVTASPSSVTVGLGATAVFRAAATGNPAPSVQWEAEAPGATSFTPVPGATRDTLTVRVTGAAQSGTQYRAVFTNTVDLAESTLADTARTGTATLTVKQ